MPVQQVTGTPAPKSGSLDEQLRQRLAETGALSSADMAAAAEAAASTGPVGPVSGTVRASAPAKEYDDPLTGPSPKPDAARGENLAAAAVQPELPEAEQVQADITDEERNAFLDALVHNTRFALPFSIYGGRVSGVVRARTQDETRAIIGQLQREIREKQIESDADYTVRLRAMLMAAQIHVYQGAETATLKTPLFWQRSADGKETPPPWLEQAQGWQNLDEGLAAALSEVIRKFEVKYWLLVRHAHDQDFWPTATST